MVSAVGLGSDIKPKAWLGTRHVQAMMLFFIWVLCGGMRTNMSIAIVDMTDVTNEQHFDWSLQIQSLILSSYYWLFMALQIPGGIVLGRFGGSNLMLTGLTCNSVITLCTPYAALYGGWKLVCVCRILLGLTQGLIIPATHHLISKWIPPSEQSRTIACIYSGVYLGIGFQFTISGLIAAAWGWQYIFYVNGICGGVCAVIYISFGAETPEKSRFISKEERLYIQTSLGQLGEQKKYKTPWKAIFTSVPFIAVFLGHCTDIWGFSTMSAETPTYLKKVMGIDIKANGLLSAIPYYTLFPLTFVFGYTSDLLINKKWLSISNTRKLSSCIATYGPAIAMIVLSYSPTQNITAAIVFISFVVGLSGACLTGTVSVFLDIAPNFAGTLLGIGNGCANFLAIIAPLAAGALINDETDPAEWRKVFFLAAAIYTVGNTLFVIYGTSEVQKWNNPEPVERDSESTNATKEKY